MINKGWGSVRAQLRLYANFGLRKSFMNRKNPHLSRKLHLCLCQNAVKSNLSTVNCTFCLRRICHSRRVVDALRLQAKFHGPLYLRKERAPWRIKLELESRMDAELQSQHKTVRKTMEPCS